MAAMKVLYTIGYSTRGVNEFISLLLARRIERIIDIRAIPQSRYCPQFSQTALKMSLRKAKIGYRHLKDLGGLRHPVKDSVNTGWKNASFRGFADYMQTASFSRGIEKLEKLAREKKCAIMCAEAVPWRCHRSLIADAMTVRKWKVVHVMSKKSSRIHKRTAFLKVKKGKLFYEKLEYDPIIRMKRKR
jgi:uncharacterized protein (DUF488 family)